MDAECQIPTLRPSDPPHCLVKIAKGECLARCDLGDPCLRRLALNLIAPGEGDSAKPCLKELATPHAIAATATLATWQHSRQETASRQAARRLDPSPAL